ncbi:unnamed protein product [Auanema sp. JU1783]|nr:unnamed protein product [Auanema sp. JU1783]
MDESPNCETKLIEEIKDRPLFYLAPMVRYSKLPFRELVRKYDVDCCYTPMIYAKNFLESEYCRKSEFTTVPNDKPLIVQFASDDPFVFASAAQVVYKYSTGVDLNCGCPKGDVRAKGFGSFLLNKPELLADMVRQTRAAVNDSEYTISLKIRVQYPLDRTIDLCRKAEKAGVSHLTVHGRTPQQRAEPVDYDAIRLIKESVQVPIIANGDITSLSQALDIAARTGVNGLMSANGLLYNPAFFAGYEYTPSECISDFVDISSKYGLTTQLFHQHLIYMTRHQFSPAQRRVFNELTSRAAMEDFLSDAFEFERKL